MNLIQRLVINVHVVNWNLSFVFLKVSGFEWVENALKVSSLLVLNTIIILGT